MFEKRKLKNCIHYYCYHQRYLNDLISTFNLNNYDYAFVGGFVRWVIDKDTNPNGPRDFDIIVDIPKEDLERLLKLYHIKYTKNDFGGFKIPPHPDDTFANKEIDVWTLDSHTPFESFVKAYGICKNINKFCSFKNLPKTSFLSIDGATYWVNKNKLYARDCKKTLKTKSIYLTDNLCVSYQNIDRKSLVAKLIHYYHEGYDLNKDCWGLISAYFAKHDTTKLVHWLDKHYPNSLLDWKEFMDERIYPKVQASIFELNKVAGK